MLFVIFDVEAASFYPWAVQMHALRVFGLLEMVVFIVVLAIGYAYVWKKGGLRLAVSASPGHFMLARLDDVARWAQSSSRLAADDGPRLLRHRDDDGDVARVRHRAIRARRSFAARPARPI